MDVLVLVAAFVIILIGAELFTNGIEWFGRKLELAEGAVGSVLAAVGTALPETMIPIIAILTGGGSSESHGVGVGAILGAPFMLSTLAMFVTGVAVIVVAVLIGIFGWYVKPHFEPAPNVDADVLAPLRVRRHHRPAHNENPTVPRL